jgi:hypothetical protein
VDERPESVDSFPSGDVRKGDGSNSQWKKTVTSSGGISWLQLRVVEEVWLQVRRFNNWQRRDLHELQLQLP